ncbi:diguanylate cyclase [Thermodesulfobacteriota bacterium]
MDIWEKLQAVEQNLANREKKLQAIAHSFPHPILIIDGFGKYLNVIGGEDRSLYHSGKHLVGKYLHDVLPENLAETFIQAITDAIEDNTLKVIEYMLGPEDVIDSPPDSPKGRQWFETRIYPVSDQDSEEKSVIWIPINITLRRTLEEQVKNLSERDPLTETYNRRYFLQIFEKEFSISKRYKDRFSVLLIDIDNFNSIPSFFLGLIQSRTHPSQCRNASDRI